MSGAVALTLDTCAHAGATINGIAFDAASVKIRAAAAGANDTRQVNGTSGIISTVASAAGFGAAVAANTDGTINTTAGTPVS